MLGIRTITLGTNAAAIVDRDALVKPYLAISGTSENALLDLWIASATAQAETYCDRFFLSRTVVERLQDVDATRQLVLTHKPVITFTSITDDDGITVSSSLYTVDKDAGIVSLNDGTEFEGDIIVSYTAGYTTAPAAVQIAICDLVKQQRNSRLRNDDVVLVQSPDAGSMSYKGAVPGVTTKAGNMAGMPESVMRALEPYKRRFA